MPLTANMTQTSAANRTLSTIISTTLSAMISDSSSNATSVAIQTKPSDLSTSQTVIMTIFLTFLILVTLFGNGLVVGIFYNYRPLRTVTNYFIVSLAVADILVAALSMPIWIAYIHVGLAPTGYGLVVYRLWICVDITSGVSSVLNLSFVSVDRYIHIFIPLRYESVMTGKRAKFILCGIWLYAAGLASVKGIAFYWVRPNYEILVFVMGFLVPFLVMGCCHYKIFCAARQHRRAMKRSCRPSNEPSRDFQAAKTVAVVILAFFICWCPFYIVNLCFGFLPDWDVPSTLITVTKCLHYVNSVLNPLIYACFNTAYRSAFKALLTRRNLQNGNWESSNQNVRRQLPLKQVPKDPSCITELIEEDSSANL